MILGSFFTKPLAGAIRGFAPPTQMTHCSSLVSDKMLACDDLGWEVVEATVSSLLAKASPAQRVETASASRQILLQLQEKYGVFQLKPYFQDF